MHAGEKQKSLQHMIKKYIDIQLSSILVYMHAGEKKKSLQHMIKKYIDIQLSSKIYEIKTSKSCKINLGHLENVSYTIPISPVRL
jgi:hypothetical protein